MLRSGLPHYLWVEAYLHVAHAQNLLPSHALLHRETLLNGKKRKLADVTELEDQVSDFCRCVPYFLYYGDVSEKAFELLVEQMRPFGVRVVAYPRRNDLKYLEARGVIGFFMGLGDGPSMDRVYVKSTTKSTVREYRHVVTPRVCLEEYAMKLHSSEVHTASDMSDEQVLADQQELPSFERGLFEVDARNPDEVLPYTDEPFMDIVRAIATFDTVRAVPPDPTRRTVASGESTSNRKRGSIRPSASGTTSLALRFTLWSIHGSTGRRTPSSRRPMGRPGYSVAMLREALQKSLPAWWLRPVSACCRCGSQTWALHEAWTSSIRLLLLHMWVQKNVFAQYIGIDVS